jgi:peptidoglycan/xylan/chitin deacetylase (PgdA/CDA1 family)
VSRSSRSGASRALVTSFGFHDVTDWPGDSGFQRSGAGPYKLGTGAFAAHLEQFAATSAVPELVDRVDLAHPGRHLLLTFDDGGSSALYIAERLERRGWLGHFFISTGLIGRRTFLDTRGIKQLRNAGHLIGTHSHSHPDIYRELPWDRMVVEWRQSSDILAQLLGEPCDTGAVPGGESSEAVFRSAAAAGLRFLFTSEPRVQPRIVGGCWILGRFCVKASTRPEDVGRLALGQGWGNQLLVRRLKRALSQSLPPLYRLYVSRSTREWQETVS